MGKSQPYGTDREQPYDSLRSLSGPEEFPFQSSAFW